ncbi:MAG: MBL fold metallo-hydrolase [Gluconacetobacter diazotrophicus]|nr:MBL fold metallo-hydrolase [Gluconacetobacter diazotrophicus]
MSNITSDAAVGAVHWPVGDILVTALSDGYYETPMADVVRRIPVERAEALQKDAGRAADRPRINHVMYLVRAPGRAPILVDAGMGDAWGPTMGTMSRALRALAVPPSEIGTILLTHLHLDHAAGLTDRAGRAVYPNAEILVAADEAAYWLDEATAGRAPAEQRMWFDGARKALAPYRGRTRLFGGGEVLPGITAVPLPGHTPGHTGFRVEGGARSLLVWGDIVHLPHVQAPEPDAGVVFDVDGARAAETRRTALEMAAEEGSCVAGMHTEFPGLGTVRRRGTGYVIVPELWASFQD